ncbi:MAG: hypothetical protein WKG00_15535 [Polyangiaceae bacterium]
MIARTPFASLAALALAIAGCGSTVNDKDDADQGAGGSTGNGTTGNGTSGVGASGTTSGTTGTGGACAGYQDAEGSGEVTVRVVNNAPVAIYIPRNCDAGTFSVLGEDGKEWHQDLSCELSCEQLQTSPQIACGGECQPSVIQIPSFGTAELVWRGTGLLSANMPEACYFDEAFSETCRQVIAAPAQVYRLQVPGYAECHDFDGEACACVDGICQGAEVSGFQGFHNEAQLDYPALHTVDVVFDTCAFGCPNGEDDDPQPGEGGTP